MTDEVARISKILNSGKVKATVWCYECGEWGVGEVEVTKVHAGTKTHQDHQRHKWRIKEVLD